MTRIAVVTFMKRGEGGSFQYGLCLLNALPRWKPDICVRLEQGYTPVEDICKTVGPVHDLMHRYEPHFPEVGSVNELKSREYVFSNHSRTASAILVDSEVGKQHVLECYKADESRIFVLPFCASHLQGLQEQKPANFSLAEGHSFLFYPAQMWLHKNHVNLLHAVALLRDQLDIHCVFTGTTDKSGYRAYHDAVNDLKLGDKVHHLGYVSDAETVWLYKNARCMIMPTFLGPTNIPPLEAFLFGCPVAVSNVYGMPEQLGDAALYFDPHKPEDIARCVATLWTDQDKWGELRERGLASAKAYSAKEFEQRFIDIITNKIG